MRRLAQQQAFKMSRGTLVAVLMLGLLQVGPQLAHSYPLPQSMSQRSDRQIDSVGTRQGRRLSHTLEAQSLPQVGALAAETVSPGTGPTLQLEGACLPFYSFATPAERTATTTA